jgi:hypothetical protein
VTPYPGPGRKWQISTDGGFHAMWSRDGREIVYGSGDGRLMAAAFTPGAALTPARPRELLKLPPGTDYFDMAPDGRTLAIADRGDQSPVRELSIVLNWSESLKARVHGPL